MVAPVLQDHFFMNSAPLCSMCLYLKLLISHLGHPTRYVFDDAKLWLGDKVGIFLNSPQSRQHLQIWCRALRRVSKICTYNWLQSHSWCLLMPLFQLRCVILLALLACLEEISMLVTSPNTCLCGCRSLREEERKVLLSSNLTQLLCFKLWTKGQPVSQLGFDPWHILSSCQATYVAHTLSLSWDCYCSALRAD